jgi:GNAT superfamily N-acetyltransferase
MAPPLGLSFSVTTILVDRRLTSPATNRKSYVSKPPSIVSGTTTSTTTTTQLGLFFADPSPSKKNQPPQPPQQQQQQNDQVEPAVAAIIPPKPSSSPSPSSPSIELITSDDEDFLNMVGYFLVDAFWLSSEHHQLGVDDVSQALSSDVKMNLVVEQASDLQDKYGPRLGSRMFQSSVIAALDQDTKATVGVVTLKATLLMENLIKGTTIVLEADEAEVMVKNAVAQLGPKQRRLYKNAPVETIVKELLMVPSSTTNNIKAIVVLSNLAVSPQARRRGIAKTLCQEALAMVAEWGFTELYLLVEEANVAARSLYETQLGYRLAFRNDGAKALRVDLETGSFVEIEADTLGLVKQVNES